MVYCHAAYLARKQLPHEALNTLIASVARFCPADATVLRNALAAAREAPIRAGRVARRIFQCLLLSHVGDGGQPVNGGEEEEDDDDDVTGEDENEDERMAVVDGDDEERELHRQLQRLQPTSLRLASGEKLLDIQQELFAWLCFCLLESLANTAATEQAFESALATLHGLSQRKAIALELLRFVVGKRQRSDNEIVALAARLVLEVSPSFLRGSLLYSDLDASVRDITSLQSLVYPACAEDYSFIEAVVNTVSVALAPNTVVFLSRTLLQSFPRCTFLLLRYGAMSITALMLLFARTHSLSLSISLSLTRSRTIGLQRHFYLMESDRRLTN